MTAPATIIDVLLAALEPHRNTKHGKDRYDTPWRTAADGGTLSIERDESYGGGLKWYDHKEDRGGNGLTLAKELGISLDKGTVKALPKPTYASLDVYAQAHGLPLDALQAAGWYEARRAGQLVFAFGTLGGERYRYADEATAGRKYDHQKGYSACWYGLERATAIASERGLPLVLCNGEISTITAQHYGVPACCVTGGERTSIKIELLDILLEAWGGPVLVAFDCDETGRKSGQGITRQLQAVRDDVQLVDLGGAFGFDLADFCQLHTDTSMQALQARAGDTAPHAPSPEPRTYTVGPSLPIDANDLLALERKPIRWYAPGFVREGLGLLVGQPGVGKTPLVMQLAIAMANGSKWLNAVDCRRSRVLYLGMEYSRQELLPLLDQSRCGAKIERGQFMFKTLDDDDIFPKTADEALAQLENYIAVMGFDVIIIDVLTGFLPSEGFKQNVYRGDYSELKPYHRLAMQHNASILGVWHASKREADPRLMYNGSTGMWAACASRITMYADIEQRVRIASFARLSDKIDWALTQHQSIMGRKWVLADADPEPVMGPQEQVIYRWLRANSDKATPKTPATIAEMTGLAPNSTRTVLGRMFEKNIIQSPKGGSGYYVDVADVALVADVTPVADVADVAHTKDNAYESATYVAPMLREETASESLKTPRNMRNIKTAQHEAQQTQQTEDARTQQQIDRDAAYDDRQFEAAQRAIDGKRWTQAAQAIGGMRNAERRNAQQARLLRLQHESNQERAAT